jgi:hypothetical protein
MSKNPIKTVTYESVGKFVEAACVNAGVSSKCSQTIGESGFHGTETFAEAVEQSKKGWPAGVAKLSKVRATLDHLVEKAIAVKGKNLRWDVTGDFLDVGRYLAGEPECNGEFRDEDEGQLQTRVVRLVANVSAMGGVNSKSIFSAGAALYAAVDILESLGHRVELWLGSGSERDSKRLQVYVLIKDASQQFDPDRLAFFLCSNASLRRLFFSVEEDLGFPPNGTSTTPLVADKDMVVTPEVNQWDDTDAKRIERVLKVCESAGVRFSQDELAEITA